MEMFYILFDNFQKCFNIHVPGYQIYISAHLNNQDNGE